MPTDQLSADEGRSPELQQRALSWLLVDHPGDIGNTRGLIWDLSKLVDRLVEDLTRLREECDRPKWTCFHCGETFTTPGGARDHFGATPESTTGCLIDRVALEEGGKPERGRGLLMALRKAEAELSRLRDAHRQVTRFEAIAENGRVLSRWGCVIELSYQDHGRTLKVFVKDRPSQPDRGDFTTAPPTESA